MILWYWSAPHVSARPADSYQSIADTFVQWNLSLRSLIIVVHRIRSNQFAADFMLDITSKATGERINLREVAV